MAKEIGARVKDEETYKKFKRLCEDKGITVADQINNWIEIEVIAGSRDEDELYKTKSRLLDELGDKIIDTYQVQNFRPNKRVHLHLSDKDAITLIKYTREDVKENLTSAVNKAIVKYWGRRIAERKIPTELEELEKLKNHVVNGETMSYDELREKLIQQQISKDLIAGRMEKFNKFENIPVSFTLDSSILPTKPLHQIKIGDVKGLVSFNCIVIGFQPIRVLEYENSPKKIFTQLITIQEPEEEAINNTPKIYYCLVYGNDTQGISIGQRKKITAFLETDDKTKDDAKPILFQAVNVEDLEEMKEVKLETKKLDVTREFALVDEDEYLQKLIDSFAPHIHDRDLEKFALILTLVGGSPIGEYRKESHLLLCGEPSTGKSEMMKYAIKLAQKGAFVDGPNASSKGLLFGLDDYEKGKILRAGAVVLCNGGHVAIDEYDKMLSPDRKALNLVMEQQKAKYDKVGHNVTADAKTAIIAGCNPKGDRWSDKRTIIENLEPLSASSVSRFDVIIRLTNIKTTDAARSQIKHILKHAKHENEQFLDPESFKGLLNYCRKLEPEITKGAEKAIEEFYAYFFSLEQEEGSLPIEPRQAVGLLRLCTAYAKLTFKKEVDEGVVRKIVEFYKRTLQTLGMRVDGGVHAVDLQGRHVNKDDHFWEIYKELVKDDGLVYQTELIDKMVEYPQHWGTQEGALAYVNKLHRIGKIAETKVGRYEKV